VGRELTDLVVKVYADGKGTDVISSTGLLHWFSPGDWAELIRQIKEMPHAED
jgi:hypothetical protein